MVGLVCPALGSEEVQGAVTVWVSTGEVPPIFLPSPLYLAVREWVPTERLATEDDAGKWTHSGPSLRTTQVGDAEKVGIRPPVRREMSPLFFGDCAAAGQKALLAAVKTPCWR